MILSQAIAMHLPSLQRTSCALVGSALVFGLAPPAASMLAEPPRPRELLRVVDLYEQARFEAECDRELRGELD